MLQSLYIFICVVVSINFSYAPSNKIPYLATYLWDTSSIETQAEEYLTFSVNNHVTDIYLQYNQDIDINIIRSFIQKSHAKSINVHLLNGAPNWAQSNNKHLLTNTLDWLNTYQSSSMDNSQFDGLHLDIEYYLLDLNDESTKEAIIEYQNRITEAALFCDSNNIELSTSIPFWFDKIQIDGDLYYNNLAEWNISTVDNTVLMAYRNFLFGSNGIIDIIGKEMEYGEKNNANVSIALETRQSQEGNHLSFSGIDDIVLINTIKLINFYYASNSSFKGFAIHHIETWMEL